MGSLVFPPSFCLELFLLSSGWLYCSHLLFAWHWACSCSWALWCSCWKFFSVCGPLEKIFQLGWWTTLPSIFFVSFWNWLVLLSQMYVTWSNKKASLLFFVLGLDNSCERKKFLKISWTLRNVHVNSFGSYWFLQKNVSWKYCCF